MPASAMTQRSRRFVSYVLIPAKVGVWLLRNRWGYLPIVLYCEDRCCCDWAIRALTPDPSSITPWTIR
jgi:hypothetical protein